MDVRRKMPPGTFIDIQYRDLISDPIAQFRKMIEGIGLDCGTADIDAAAQWMSKNGRDTHPPHKYAPEDFGVSVQQLSDTFKFYHDAFLQ